MPSVARPPDQPSWLGVRCFVIIITVAAVLGTVYSAMAWKSTSNQPGWLEWCGCPVLHTAKPFVLEDVASSCCAARPASWQPPGSLSRRRARRTGFHSGCLGLGTPEARRPAGKVMLPAGAVPVPWLEGGGAAAPRPTAHAATHGPHAAPCPHRRQAQRCPHGCCRSRCCRMCHSCWVLLHRVPWQRGPPLLLPQAAHSRSRLHDWQNCESYSPDIPAGMSAVSYSSLKTQTQCSRKPGCSDVCICI